MHSLFSQRLLPIPCRTKCGTRYYDCQSYLAGLNFHHTMCILISVEDAAAIDGRYSGNAPMVAGTTSFSEENFNILLDPKCFKQKCVLVLNGPRFRFTVDSDASNKRGLGKVY